MKPQTINDVFLAIVERQQDPVMLIRGPSRWESISSQQFRRQVIGMANALRHLGLVKGDRLAILSENRHEWAVADFASLLLGVVVVPIYSTLTAQQTAYILVRFRCKGRRRVHREAVGKGDFHSASDCRATSGGHGSGSQPMMRCTCSA